MSITAQQARSWTTPGSQDAAKRTYASVGQALDHSRRLQGYSFEVFLQGSYANSTNIRGDSDVDVVAMLRSVYIPDTSLLSPAEKANEGRRGGGPATMTLDDFRRDAHAALNDYYGAARVHSKDKCLQIDGKNGYLDADVVPAYQVRRYTSYPAHDYPAWIEGIQIRPLSGGSIVNYPKEHKENGETKNLNCAGKYKQAVRQVKRLAVHAADKGLFASGAVPGYVLECMTFNVPNGRFVNGDADRLFLVLAHLHDQTPETLRRDFYSCDKVHRLFVDDPGGHNEYTARRVIDAMYGMV